VAPAPAIAEIAQTARRSREQLPPSVRAIDRVEPLAPQVTPALRALAESIAAHKRNRETANSRTRESR
jgi:hypothetical protein